MPNPKNLKVTKDNTAQFSKSLKALAENRVYVGIPADKTGRNTEPGEAINNAQLMYIHENGAPEVNIPARPVVHPTVKENRFLIQRGLKAAGEKALEGDTVGVLKTLNALGLVMQNQMRKKITDGPFAPLSERTLAARRAKGRTGTKPLIDTGQLRRALTYVIKKVKYTGKLLMG